MASRAHDAGPAATLAVRPPAWFNPLVALAGVLAALIALTVALLALTATLDLLLVVCADLVPLINAPVALADAIAAMVMTMALIPLCIALVALAAGVALVALAGGVALVALAAGVALVALAAGVALVALATGALIALSSPLVPRTRTLAALAAPNVLAIAARAGARLRRKLRSPHYWKAGRHMETIRQFGPQPWCTGESEPGRSERPLLFGVRLITGSRVGRGALPLLVAARPVAAAPVAAPPAAAATVARVRATPRYPAGLTGNPAGLTRTTAGLTGTLAGALAGSPSPFWRPAGARSAARDRRRAAGGACGHRVLGLHG
ncbi:MAG: hypothetical protein JOZ98_09670 [Solirubrobacterales bacterium]|nr:hypothetical protein [Solirubrobacterales bacterium]